jgi:hypothetical protein
LPLPEAWEHLVEHLVAVWIDGSLEAFEHQEKQEDKHVPSKETEHEDVRLSDFLFLFVPPEIAPAGSRASFFKIAYFYW